MQSQYPLSLKSVTKMYEDGDKTAIILKDLSFNIKNGEMIAIIGPSGSGKSTFLSIAGALLTPDDGEVIVNGVTINNCNESDKANVRLNQIGYIFQTSNLVPYLNVEENLFFVLKMAKQWSVASKEFCHLLLEKVGLLNRAKHYPYQLSGGEKQRAAIARAFVNHPEIILADEPTASLDSSRSLAVMELISNMVKQYNKAAIIVTHDEQILPLCDRIFTMKDGNLVEKEREFI
ncbi:ABC transporter ATP-binding protein [Neobacillus niacini]|uniref:ABC transporter ATP-binding protein n=1 Tax=Neobacillus niacini TaxID=86668 RepID=UPI00203E34BE|nr:ABC transporter ATP-binding protein [Neobacillus niacini]MCM3693444.1 ABC transporter ATP-binding protein [Neobacillus niacini]